MLCSINRRVTIEIVVVVQGLFAKYLDKAQSKLKHRQMCLKMAGDWVDGFF